jgi:hypothetical protein
LADNAKARFLQPDGSYRAAKLAPGEKPHRSQFEFIALAEAEASRKPADGKTRYPQVKLVPSPIGDRKGKS